MSSKNDPRPEVLEPTCMSEFEVQAFLWAGLRDLGFNVRGEVKTQYTKRCFVRFDLALFVDGKLAGILEVKKSAIKHHTTWEDTRQGTRYNDFGVPVKIVYGYEQAQALIEAAKSGKIFDSLLNG